MAERFFDSAVAVALLAACAQWAIGSGTCSVQRKEVTVEYNITSNSTVSCNGYSEAHCVNFRNTSSDGTKSRKTDKTIQYTSGSGCTGCSSECTNSISAGTLREGSGSVSGASNCNEVDKDQLECYTDA